MGKRLRRLLRTSLAVCGILLLGAAVLAGVWLWPRWQALDAEVGALARAHLTYEVAHPGWSFPSQIYSAPFPLAADTPPAQVAAQARARGYTPACPPQQPGEVCPKDGAVIPRGGAFPEGPQPAGREGWSRPLALEPIRLGVLIGPDAEVRWHLPLDQAPDHLIAAILAAEDEAFHQHHGADLPGLVRAAWINARGGGYAQGASTLTMQAVRSLSQRRDRTLARKLWEIGAAISLERHIGKEAVLQIYLDAPYLGQAGSLSICGFEAAARHYYGVGAAELDLGQAATLAGILPAPGRFAPDRDPEQARQRRDRVLRRMAAAGWEVSAALEAPIAALHPAPDPLPAPRHPAYLQATRQWLEANLPPEAVYGAGLHIFTAMDAVAQATSEAVMPEKAAYIEGIVGRRRAEPLEAVAVLIDADTGHLAAVYGGSQQAATDFSRATLARRQAGSAFKPLVYALAFSQRGEDGRPKWRAWHTVSNRYRVFAGTGGWAPKNIVADYSQVSTLGNALVRSQNVATATLLEALGGPAPLIALAGRAGFQTAGFPMELGLALGQAEATPLEMARFVAMVLHGGVGVTGSPVVEIRDLRGQVRPIPPALTDERVLDAEAAALTRELMGMVVRFGAGSYTRHGGGHPGYTGPSIGKTGTTDDEKDLWYVGGTPDYAGVVWLGYDQPARVGGTAADLAAPLWGWWMRAVYDAQARPMAEFEDTVPLRKGGLCSLTGAHPNETCEVFSFPLLEDDRPRGACPHQHPPRERKQGWSIWVRRGLVEEVPPTTADPGDGEAPAPPEEAPPPAPEEGEGEVPPGP